MAKLVIVLCGLAVGAVALVKASWEIGAFAVIILGVAACPRRVYRSQPPPWL